MKDYDRGDPGEGWVWLEPGEEVAPGDECRIASDPDDDWVMVQQIGWQAHGLVYRSKFKAFSCPRCGNGDQVWVNQITGILTCHRAGCQTEIKEAL